MILPHTGEGTNTLEWKKSLKNDVSASSRAMVLYFCRMAKEDNKEKMDYRFLDALLKNGGSINVTDKFGTILYDEVQSFSLRFLAQNGAVPFSNCPASDWNSFIKEAFFTIMFNSVI